MTAAPQVIIPMAGRGQRFRRAGYGTYKPFIPVLGKPMIRHVLDAFPADVRTHVITSRSLLTRDEADYLERELRCRIIDIEPHDDGPAFSVRQAQDRLPLDGPVFLSYCDIAWEWSYGEVQRELDRDGIIFTHTGFHPHLIGNNRSAFCRPRPDDPGRLQEVREKGSFTNDWMHEPLSIGLFYLRNGADMITGIDDLIARGQRVDGEYYPSLLFNGLVERGRDIRLGPVPFFVHWGVPEQLEDVERWEAVLAADAAVRPQRDPDAPENIMLMAGEGRRMAGIGDRPKSLLPVGGRPMYEHVLDHVPSRSATLVVTPALAQLLQDRDSATELFVLQQPTGSQEGTMAAAAGLLRGRRDYFLTPCDAYGLFDLQAFREFVGSRRPDAVIFTFRLPLTSRSRGGRHSHVTVSGDRVTAVHIKARSGPADPGLAGFFWVRDGRIFDGLLDGPAAAEGERIADHVFQQLVDAGRYIAAYELDQYVHLGSPEELLEHRFWSDHLRALRQGGP